MQLQERHAECEAACERRDIELSRDDDLEALANLQRKGTHALNRGPWQDIGLRNTICERGRAWMAVLAGAWHRWLPTRPVDDQCGAAAHVEVAAHVEIVRPQNLGEGVQFTLPEIERAIAREVTQLRHHATIED